MLVCLRKKGKESWRTFSKYQCLHFLQRVILLVGLGSLRRRSTLGIGRSLRRREKQMRQNIEDVEEFARPFPVLSSSQIGRLVLGSIPDDISDQGQLLLHCIFDIWLFLVCSFLQTVMAHVQRWNTSTGLLKYLRCRRFRLFSEAVLIQHSYPSVANTYLPM